MFVSSCRLSVASIGGRCFHMSGPLILAILAAGCREESETHPAERYVYSAEVAVDAFNFDTGELRISVKNTGNKTLAVCSAYVFLSEDTDNRRTLDMIPVGTCVKSPILLIRDEGDEWAGHNYVPRLTGKWEPYRSVWILPGGRAFLLLDKIGGNERQKMRPLKEEGGKLEVEAKVFLVPVDMNEGADIKNSFEVRSAPFAIESKGRGKADGKETEGERQEQE
ncbi:MAG: hypothetical protein N3A38_14525 [Planctomycetota bacterium]|nr:hypothetical protein [Planctomycetota bacterium]